MSDRPQVTITLGKTGQVVKRTGSGSDGSHTDYEPSSGNKRPIRERLGNNVSNPHSYGSRNKRQRTEDASSSLSDDDLLDDKQRTNSRRVSRDDLRYKLIHKNISKRTSAAPREQNGDLRQKLSRNSHGLLRFDERQHVPEKRAAGPVRQIPPAGSAEHLRHLESLRKSYSLALDGQRHRSPDRLIGTSRGIPPQNYDVMRPVSSMRPLDVSRPTNFITKSVVEAPRPDPLTSRATVLVENTKPVQHAPLAGGTLRKTSYVSDEQDPVAILLHSLGLGKYAIHFKAEEVDMTALKQMGDGDLKELGIPMGPRKKILLALLPRSKQRHS